MLAQNGHHGLDATVEEVQRWMHRAVSQDDDEVVAADRRCVLPKGLDVGDGDGADRIPPVVSRR